MGVRTENALFLYTLGAFLLYFFDILSFAPISEALDWTLNGWGASPPFKGVLHLILLCVLSLVAVAVAAIQPTRLLMHKRRSILVVTDDLLLCTLLGKTRVIQLADIQSVQWAKAGLLSLDTPILFAHLFYLGDMKWMRKRVVITLSNGDCHVLDPYAAFGPGEPISAAIETKRNPSARI